MAKKVVRVSDISGDEIPEGRGATVRITFADARKGARELDVTDAEAEKLGTTMRGNIVPADVYDAAAREREAFRKTRK